MAGSLFVSPRSHPVNGSGRPYAGAKRYFYGTGSSTLATVYTNSALTVAHTNPVVADSNGIFQPIWLDPSATYRSRLTTSADVLLEDVDPYPGNPNGSLTQAQIAAILYPQTELEQSASVTPSSYIPFNIVHAERFGVVGDGIEDDTTALRNACKAAGPYGHVVIRGGLNCLVTGSIVDSTLASHAVGQTWGGGGTITADTGQNYDVFALVDIDDFTVQNLVFVGGTLGATYTGSGSSGYSVNPFTARAVSFNSSVRGKVLYCKITGFQSAVQAIKGSEHCQIIGNDIISPDGWGVNIQTDSSTNSASHDCVIANNRISGVLHEHGIYVAGTATGLIRGTHIYGNTVTGCVIDGIKLSYSDNAKVHDNVSYANTKQGIYVTVGSNRNHVHHNTCYSNTENGILVYDSTGNTDRTIVDHNVCYSNTLSGINNHNASSGTVTRTLIESNVTYSNAQYGIVNSGTGATATIIRGNRTSDDTYGIRLVSGSGIQLFNNVYDGTGTAISDAATATKIDGCLYGSATWDPGSIADGDEEAKDITVTGAALGDFVEVSFSLDVADLALSAQVTAADTATASLLNNTGSSVDLTSGTVYARVRPRPV